MLTIPNPNKNETNKRFIRVPAPNSGRGGKKFNNKKDYIMFNHVPVDIPEVSTKTVKRKRSYVTPTGLYPSITTVLVFVKRNKRDYRSGVIV